jgi:hypothetical protein
MQPPALASGSFARMLHRIDSKTMASDAFQNLWCRIACRRCRIADVHRYEVERGNGPHNGEGHRNAEVVIDTSKTPSWARSPSEAIHMDDAKNAVPPTTANAPGGLAGRIRFQAPLVNVAIEAPIVTLGVNKPPSLLPVTS